MFKTWIVILISMTTLLYSSTATAPLNLVQLDELANETLSKFNVPGAAIGIVVGDQVVLARGYGKRNVELGLPVTESTQFPIASCTKAFTALLVGSLVQEGKLAWDDPVTKYIPEFKLLGSDAADKMTLRDLLAHRTGMPRHDALWIFSDISRNDVLEIFQHLSPEHELGASFQYNNFMYSVIGIVIERVTGKSWEEALNERVLMPLSMNSSNTCLDEMQKSAEFSTAYAEICGTLQCLPYQVPYVVSPGGGVNASISDMLKWVRLHLSNGEVNGIPLFDLNEMHTMQIPFPTPPSSVVTSTGIDDEMNEEGYGLGWFLGKYRNQEWVHHGGLLAGFHSDVSFLPKQGIGIVILTNSSSDGSYVIQVLRNHILDQLIEAKPVERITPLLGMRTLAKQAIKESMEKFAKHSQEPSATRALTEYAGTYDHPAYGTVTITQEGNHLKAVYGSMVTPLYYLSENTFSGQGDLIAVYGINPVVDFKFTKNESGLIESLHIPFEGFRGAKPISFKRRF